MRLFSGIASLLLALLMLLGAWVMHGDPSAPVTPAYGLGLAAAFGAFGVFQLWMRKKEKNTGI